MRRNVENGWFVKLYNLIYKVVVYAKRMISKKKLCSYPKKSKIGVNVHEGKGQIERPSSFKKLTRKFSEA